MYLAASGFAAAQICDVEKAYRMGHETLAAHAAAHGAFMGIYWGHQLQFLGRFVVGANQLLAAYARIFEMLSLCDFTSSGTRHGSFEHPGTKDMQDGHAGKNKVTFEFRIEGTAKCDTICIVQVYHLERIGTGRTEDPPSLGDTRSDPTLGAGLPPRDEDAWRGYVVDALPFDLSGSPPTGTSSAPLNPDPCYPKQTPSASGTIITGEDSPSFEKKGYRSVFETCVVCFTGSGYEILGAMRWEHDPAARESRILPAPGGGTDWGDASPPFRRALDKWRGNRP